jgi:8-oxo-dGTP pyrophosphatase MutT (NUDIX family)
MMSRSEIEATPAFRNLDRTQLQKRCVEVLATDYQTLIRLPEGVKYPWEVIVRTDGGILAVRALVIVVPKSTELKVGEDLLDVIYRVGPKQCRAVLVHEERAYPALIEDYPGTMLRELPGGVVDDADGSAKVGGGNAAVRECFEEIGASPDDVMATLPLLGVGAPASCAAQLEGHALHAVLYRGETELGISADETVRKFELVPLPQVYRSVLDQHENKVACTEVKTLLALLMLQQAYIDRFREHFFV